MKTNVYVCFNGASFDHVFDTPIDVFIKQWNNQIAGTGFYSGHDVHNKYIVINPSCCGLIEISNAK